MGKIVPVINPAMTLSSHNSESLISQRESSSRIFLCALLLLFAAITVYHNSMNGPFIFDDEPKIKNYPLIRQLWPLRHFFIENRRPVLDLTLAVNYSLGGLNVWGYHFVNLVIHMLSSLYLFGIVRRTLLTRPLREMFKGSALGFALCVSLLWTVHPLQTASVTYLIQRAESLTGLFYLMTIYSVSRAVTTPHPAWSILAVLVCALGMATKAVMVTAPVAVLLYDRVFLSSSFSEIFKKRKGLYLALGSTWGICAYILWQMRSESFPSAGFQFAGISPWQYLLTQSGVILHYLKLAVLGSPLVFDYADWPRAVTIMDVLPSFVIIILLLTGIGWIWRINRPLGYLGFLFFLLLTPTSSVLPLADAVFDHRMYLPLAVIIIIMVSGVRVLSIKMIPDAHKRRLLLIFFMIVAIGQLGYLTFKRNRDYQNEVTIWQDTIAKRNSNARAYNVLGTIFFDKGKFNEAEDYYRKALALAPQDATIYNNLGLLFIEQGKIEEAKYYYRQLLGSDSNIAAVINNNFGLALSREGKYEEATAYYLKAIELGFRESSVYSNLGIAYSQLGQSDQAIPYYIKALDLDPGDETAARKLTEIFNNEGLIHQ